MQEEQQAAAQQDHASRSMLATTGGGVPNPHPSQANLLRAGSGYKLPVHVSLADLLAPKAARQLPPQRQLGSGGGTLRGGGGGGGYGRKDSDPFADPGGNGGFAPGLSGSGFGFSGGMGAKEGQIIEAMPVGSFNSGGIGSPISTGARARAAARSAADSGPRPPSQERGSSRGSRGSACGRPVEKGRKSIGLGFLTGKTKLQLMRIPPTPPTISRRRARRRELEDMALRV
jgi:hypothetical protein